MKEAETEREAEAEKENAYTTAHRNGNAESGRRWMLAPTPTQTPTQTPSNAHTIAQDFA